METVRTCIGCRQRDIQSTLVRLVNVEGKIELSRTMPGRGAWLHPVDTCINRAITAKAIARAVKAEVTNLEELHNLIHHVSPDS